MVRAACSAVAALFTCCSSGLQAGFPATAAALLAAMREAPLPALVHCTSAIALALTHADDETGLAHVAVEEGSSLSQIPSLLEGIGVLVAALPPATSLAQHTEQQQVLSAWFDLAASSLSKDASASMLLPAVPSLVQALWRVVCPPPTSRHFCQHLEGALAIRRAFALLQNAAALPPHAVGAAALRISFSADFGKEFGEALPFGALLLRAVLAGLSSWMPSWLIGEAAACCWGLRQSNSDAFGYWLAAAIAPDNMPRVGLSVAVKHDFERLLREAGDRAHFKAAMKQLCGGKKKNTSGTPALGTSHER